MGNLESGPDPAPENVPGGSPGEAGAEAAAGRDREPAGEGPAARRRWLLTQVLPTAVILTAICLPLILGQRTLYLRDVFGTHLGMKWFQAESLRAGELPLIDPHRAGGQASLGNPNTVPLYPGNLLYAVAGPIWALNAHFWIHLLIAPFALYWLARRWRVRREAAWMGGVAYAASGYFLSTLNLYNLVAVAALAPALIAACLALAEERRGRRFAAVVGLWALLILGGDPMSATMALALALGAVAVRDGARGSSWRPLAGALALGTLAALPQLVELARILPHTFRGFWGYSGTAATVVSWRPTAVIEWLSPLFFGWPDLGYWGREITGGELPLFFSLAPGVLALGLALASGRPSRPAAWWAWAAVALGLFMALGRHNPLLGLLLGLPGADLLRLPIKFWLLVAIGGALLVALGCERLWSGEGGAFARILAALLALDAAFWLFLSFGGAAAFGWARRRIPSAFGDGFVDSERLRWAGVALIVAGVLAAGLGLARLAGRHRGLLALLPLLHLGSQILLLEPLIATDEVGPYLEPPALLAAVPAGASVAHGDANALFGPPAMPLDRYPDRRLIWFQRQTHEQLYPHSGVRWRRYELNPSPEGLDAFLTRAAAQAMKILPDPARLKLLEASGVDRLLVGRRLELLEAAGGVELVHTGSTPYGDIYVYGIPGRVERARLVGTIVRAPHLNRALEILTAPSFDARAATVLPGAGGGRSGPPGEVEWIAEGAESMELDVTSLEGGALVVQRTPLPIYRAEIDGVAAPIVPADLHRIGVEVGPGRHRVRIWADRTPFRVAAAISLAALLAAAVVSMRLQRSARV